MSKEHIGFFKTGDCIEISGRLIGIVAKANSEVIWVNRFSPSTGLGMFINRDMLAYSNRPKNYVGKYWIRTVPNPNVNSFVDVGLLS